jgi:alpha-amylase
MEMIKLHSHVVIKVKKLNHSISSEKKTPIQCLAFIAINNDDNGLDQWLQTGLPQGQYCDVISGNLEQGRCTGKTIAVQGDGRAQITISNFEADPMIALHINAKL